MKLRDWLDERRIENGQFAADIGVHPMTVSKYRNGRMVPRSDVMEKIFRRTEGAVRPDDFHESEFL